MLAFVYQLVRFQSSSLLMSWKKQWKVWAPSTHVEDSNEESGFSLVQPWLMWTCEE